MFSLFEVTDKSGRKIHLSRERWSHINAEHPEVAPYLEDIKDTLSSPLRVVHDNDADVYYYYKYFKQKKSYLLVIVKYLNGKGFIISAYFVRNVK